MTDHHRWRRAGSLLFSMGVGILIAALLRGMTTIESPTTSQREGSAGVVLGPLLLEPREIRFAITHVEPEGPVDIEVLRLPKSATVLNFPNIRAKEFHNISGLERGLYMFSIKASGNSSIETISFTFIADGPPRDMVHLSLILGLIGVIIFLLPEFFKSGKRITITR
ncbi:MAG: hypothetical protein QXN75_04785 [Thermoproteota archaeon]|nr:hypothetical protein [Candidatus Brockarchaeota archaeon]